MKYKTIFKQWGIVFIKNIGLFDYVLKLVFKLKNKKYFLKTSLRKYDKMNLKFFILIFEYSVTKLIIWILWQQIWKKKKIIFWPNSN